MAALRLAMPPCRGAAERGRFGEVIGRIMIELDFPPGTPVCVGQSMRRRGVDLDCEVIGVVEEWDDLPTGSWFAAGKDDKLWLRRLKLRKLDGELTLLVVDERTRIARLERAKAGA